MLEGYKKLAMQYSPRNAIMYVSLVDAGTIELLREMGKSIVSSADLVSRFEAVLTPEQIASHYQAQPTHRRDCQCCLEAHRHAAALRQRNSASMNMTVMVWLQEAMRRAGFAEAYGPNVSVNANSSDSHYEPTAAVSKPIHEGDFLLIDIWGRMDRPGTCFYDITWTGVVGREPTRT